jgi:hypothetical protein
MANKCLLLLPVTLCLLLLVLDVAAQDDDNMYALTVNGTVTCDGNPSANLTSKQSCPQEINEFKLCFIIGRIDT